MPDVNIRFLDADAPIGDREPLKEINLPRSFWEDWKTRNPMHEMADLIGEAINEFDGIDLDIRIEFIVVPGEQRQPGGRG